MNKVRNEIAAARLGAVTADDTGAIEGRYLFAPDFCGFSGHFPGHAILPAIVEIMLAVSLVSEYIGESHRLVAVDDAKFLTPVRPSQEIVVKCRERIVRGRALWDAQLSVEGTTSATMLLQLEVAKEAQ
jgi:3-hydroxyacyl-[acyl-carrier-protein] dehydratase